jgi:hypothetical protein
MNNMNQSFSDSAPSAKWGGRASMMRYQEEFNQSEARRKELEHQRALEVACISGGRTLQQCGLRS